MTEQNRDAAWLAFIDRMRSHRWEWKPGRFPRYVQRFERNGATYDPVTGELKKNGRSRHVGAWRSFYFDETVPDEASL